MSQQEETIEDQVLTLSSLGKRPEAESIEALNLCLGHVLTVGKKKDIKSKRGELQLHGSYEAGETLHGSTWTRKELCIGILFPVFHPRSASVKSITENQLEI